MNLSDEAIETMVRTYEADALGPFDSFERRCTAMRAALGAAAPFLGVPDGWVMVPKEPHFVQITAGRKAINRSPSQAIYRDLGAAYKAMILAPPPADRGE